MATTSDPHAALAHRALIERNVTWLRQSMALVMSIEDAHFTTSPVNMAPHRVGAHLRHIIEFYECFLDGAANGVVDYDARLRDESVERQRSVALARILSIIHHLETSGHFHSARALWVKAEDAGAMENSFLLSSIGRELLALSSHTIHHFALIAMTLRGWGVEVDRNFGMAPSTLRYQAMQRSAAKAEAA